MRRQNSRLKIGLLLGAVVAAVVPCAAAQAWTENVLYAFKGGSDGAVPESTLIMDHHGNLYGTTYEGGGACKLNQGCGTVFKVTPDGMETVLYAFQGAPDGSEPMASLVRDAQHNLYGTTYRGGKSGGTVFKVTRAGVYSILYVFQSNSDGGRPLAGLALDGTGNLYGTTSKGGSAACGCGTVFKLTPAGAHTVLDSFRGGSDGDVPWSPPILDGQGNLYGTTAQGGSAKCSVGCGAVYRLAQDGTETILHRFRGGHDGEAPLGDLALAPNGSVSGTTEDGGGTGCGGIGCGTVFKVLPDGTETVLSKLGRSNGPAHPTGGVTGTLGGVLFGTSFEGGSAGCGTVFRLAPGHRARAIYSFSCRADGAYPEAGLLRGKDGTLYGTTTAGGNGFGVVFALRK